MICSSSMIRASRLGLGNRSRTRSFTLATRNGSRNDDIVRDCMIAKGYKLTPQK